MSFALTQFRQAVKLLRDEGWGVTYSISHPLMGEENARLDMPAPGPTKPNPVGRLPRTHCQRCGLDISQPVGYVCQAAGCPTFPRNPPFGGSSTSGTLT